MSTVERIIEVPDDVKVALRGARVTVTGPKGTLEEDMGHMSFEFATLGKNLIIKKSYARKRDIAMAGTAAARIRNLIRGVREGFTYKLKIVTAHFPLTVKINEKQKLLLIENFIGEKTPRTVKIIGDTKVKVSGDDILVQGIDLDSVSQTAANIQAATKIKGKDQRVFLDGIYVYEKIEGM